MTPQLEEAVRLLRLARRDQAAFAILAAAVEIDDAIACFHAQQSAEKALKAVLCLRGIEYRRTHDLEELGGMLADAGLSPLVGVTDLRRLTPYAVEFRYDDDPLHLITRAQAAEIVEKLLAWATRCISDDGTASEDSSPGS